MLRISAALTALIVLFSPFLAAQSTNTLTLKRHTVSSGGGSASDGGYTLMGTVSQSAIGTTASSAISHGVGFWHTFVDNVAVSAGPLPLSADASLGQNYPNPFTESTTIPYTVRTGGKYTLTLHSIDGRITTKLKDSDHAPGTFKVSFHPRGLKPGVYAVRLAGKNIHLQRMFVYLGK